MQDPTPRKSFYSTEFDSDRANALLLKLITTCTLKEIFWITNNIFYDQVAYWGSDNHSIIYTEEQEGSRTHLNVEQANRFQQQLRTLLDLYEQSILDKREFDEDYLKSYEFAAPYLRIIEDLKDTNN